MTIRELIRGLAATGVPVAVIPGTVTAVAGATCDVQPDEPGAAPLLGVLLLPVAGAGLLLTPAVGALCLVAPVDGDANTCVLLTCSDTDSIALRGTALGGLVKAQTLRDELTKTNVVVAAIAQAITTWAPLAGDGGAALKVAATAALAGKTVGDFSQLENPNVTHA